jgi:hypothetical protein
MPRQKKGEPAAAPPEKEKLPYTRVPVRLSREEHTRLRVFCIRIGESLETIAGRWIADRLAAEEKKLGK